MSIPKFRNPDLLHSNGNQSTRAFLNVSEAAWLLRLSRMTLYRAIHDDEFPAVRIRGRYIVPTKAIEEMIAAALAEGRPVDAADWVRAETVSADRMLGGELR